MDRFPLGTSARKWPERGLSSLEGALPSSLIPTPERSGAVVGLDLEQVRGAPNPSRPDVPIARTERSR
jgi:hypothetical protein